MNLATSMALGMALLMSTTAFAATTFTVIIESGTPKVHRSVPNLLGLTLTTDLAEMLRRTPEIA